MPHLQRISVPRYFKSHQLGAVKSTQLHHFSDASTEGYGAVSYLRFVDVSDKIHCSLVMGKSRVTPTKPTTIPRLELIAATVAVKQNCQIREELDLQIDATLFWTDSSCVLQYINKEAGRFKKFVTNRIATIHNGSSPSQWRYVSSELNPADYASRGLSSTNQREIDQWINGPSFLRKSEESWPNRPEGINVMSDEKLEWKRNVEIYETQAEEIKPLDTFIKHYSSRYRLQKGIVWLIRFINYLRGSTPPDASTPGRGDLIEAGVGQSTSCEVQGFDLFVRCKKRPFPMKSRVSNAGRAVDLLPKSS